MGKLRQIGEQTGWATDSQIINCKVLIFHIPDTAGADPPRSQSLFGDFFESETDKRMIMTYMHQRIKGHTLKADEYSVEIFPWDSPYNSHL